MNLIRTIYIVWYRDILKYWRNKAQIISSLAMPFLWLVFFGIGIQTALNTTRTGEDALSNAGFDYVTFLFPGIIGMTLLFTSIFSAVSIVSDREFGFLKEILVAPVPRSGVAVGRILGGSTIAMIQGSIMLAISPWVGVHLTVKMILLFIPAMFLMAAVLTSLGIMVASRLKTSSGFQMVIQFMVMPMFILSGALFPLTGVPRWMEIVALVNPATYGVDLLRNIIFRFSDLPSSIYDLFLLRAFDHVVGPSIDFSVLFMLGAIFLSVAVWMFSKSE